MPFTGKGIRQYALKIFLEESKAGGKLSFQVYTTRTIHGTRYISIEHLALYGESIDFDRCVLGKGKEQIRVHPEGFFPEGVVIKEGGMNFQIVKSGCSAQGEGSKITFHCQREICAAQELQIRWQGEHCTQEGHDVIERTSSGKEQPAAGILLKVINSARNCQVEKITLYRNRFNLNHTGVKCEVDIVRKDNAGLCKG